MFSNGDPYKKYHNRRRRSPRALVLAGLALTLVGCAAAAAILTNPDEAVPPTDNRKVVAMLTASDAVRAATELAVPPQAYAATLPEVPDNLPDPSVWSAGRTSSLDGALKKNQSISVALGKRGVPQSSIHAVVMAMNSDFDFRRSRPGDDWEVDIDGDGRIQRFRYQASPVDVWETSWTGEAYQTKRIEVPVETRVEVVSGSINSSLWQAFAAPGAGGQLAVSYADIFAYTVDFGTETQPGDRFAVAFESTWLDGKRLDRGRIVGARYSGAAGDHYAFYWEGKDGEGAYYTEKGESVERQFLRSPIDSVRVTSRYGKRFHPVLKRMKLHAGVDYGAPTGTPVRAVANGRVVHAGWKGANGKLVSIRHANGYLTHYAHLSRINVRNGQRVKKKDIIGKVGNTGRSTGPHLHFGMKQHGRYVNPLEIDFERGTPLRGGEKSRFLAEVGELKGQLSR
jgi:murein DD-endopeptidase MepM/ murein hydrolase activator NlpD